MADNHPPVHSHVGMFSGKGNYSIYGHKFDLNKDYSKYAFPYDMAEMRTLIHHGEKPIRISKAILLRKLPKKFRQEYLEQRERLKQYIAEDEAKKNAQESCEEISK